MLEWPTWTDTDRPRLIVETGQPLLLVETEHPGPSAEMDQLGPSNFRQGRLIEFVQCQIN